MTEEIIPGVNHPGRHLNDGPADVQIIDGKIVPNETRVDRQRKAFEGRTRWTAPTPDADGFFVWPGGIIPVDPLAKVDVRMAGGYETAGSAFRFDWEHEGDAADDVVAFRIRPAY